MEATIFIIRVKGLNCLIYVMGSSENNSCYMFMEMNHMNMVSIPLHVMYLTSKISVHLCNIS